MTRRTAVAVISVPPVRTDERLPLHRNLKRPVGQQNEDEMDKCMQMADPKHFWYSPETTHPSLAIDALQSLERPRNGLIPGGARVPQSIQLKDWICADNDTACKGPRAAYERGGRSVANKLEPVYA